MVINIEKIKVGPRIRKDFGNLDELAEDIKENGLINPPVINKNYELLAGERRLRACKLLGWTQIEVRMMDTRDAEHELNIEISENESRKEFSRGERADYMKRMMRIEQAKSREISDRNLKQNADTEVPNLAHRGEEKTRDIVSSAFGIGHTTMAKEIAIVDHKDMIPAEDFADWDAGKLSTNHVFRNLQAKLKEAEDRASALETQCQYEHQRRVEAESQPPKEVVREVVPEDYESLKHDLGVMKSENSRLFGEKEKFAKEAREALQRIEEMERQTAEGKQGDKAIREMRLFAVAVKDLLHLYGSVMWVLDSLEDADESTRNNFINSIKIGYAYFNVLMNDIGGLNGIVNE